jgi:hypothetical protein
MEDLVTPDPALWRRKRVLLTGHTGFKGAWLALWLHRLGAEVTGVALAAIVRETRPDIVLHLAAQALVRAGYLAMQEIIWKVQPDTLIETGIAHGGSDIFSAAMLELNSAGR